ncbi:MAG: DUF3226 domain-containing protein [Capsulimonas sp.]|uniref:DUF3226 domain-containing protein n=1 Tax=Capsulimonas sp. TaxID=2494211 RepID=UPI003265EDE5
MRRNSDSLKIEEGPESDILIVEGADDFFLLKNWFLRFRLVGKIRLEEGGGYERLRDSIDTRVDASNLERFGVIVDADEDLPSRWLSIRGAFENAGYEMPAEPQTSGTIVVQAERPTIGIWIMPDNRLPGELEDFVRMLIPEADSLWPRACNAIDDIPEAERLFKESISKARLHTWLAWQEEPGKPIGQAIVKRYFSTETEQAKAFQKWLMDLYKIA